MHDSMSVLLMRTCTFDLLFKLRKLLNLQENIRSDYFINVWYYDKGLVNVDLDSVK